jgi:glucose-6-phosphate isomerase
VLNTQTYTLPSKLEAEFHSAAADWIANERIARLWKKDASLWTGTDEARWLDWLYVVEAEIGKVADYEAFAREIANEGFTDFLLMGMGGSSLCPEVLAVTFGRKNFHVLDSTDPAQIKTIESKLSIDKTLFIVASKSGSTLEPNTFKQYFFDVVSKRVGAENAGRQFVAITDPGSKMQRVAEADGFRRIFFGNPEIGGRFSALSPFGMTAATAMGIDVGDFLSRANEMVLACRDENAGMNPSAQLGLILGICQ